MGTNGGPCAPLVALGETQAPCSEFPRLSRGLPRRSDDPREALRTTPQNLRVLYPPRRRTEEPSFSPTAFRDSTEISFLELGQKSSPLGGVVYRGLEEGVKKFCDGWVTQAGRVRDPGDGDLSPG